MPKEIINTDPALSKEFYDMLDEQREKLSKEEMARRALWGLEVLIQEGLINPESTVAEIITVIEKRRMELKGSMDYAEELKHSGISDEVDASLHKVAVEESEKSKRILNYLVYSAAILQSNQLPGFDEDSKLKKIQVLLESYLKKAEDAILKDEQEKRKK